MTFDITFMLFIIIIILAAIFALVATNPGPKKSKR